MPIKYWRNKDMIDDELVIVRGINDEFLKENFADFDIYFGGETPQTIPASVTRFLGFYLANSDRCVSHIGIVKNVNEERTKWNISAILKLLHPISVDHAIRKHECWRIDNFHKNDVNRMIALHEILK
jgi:hypothetical protein